MAKGYGRGMPGMGGGMNMNMLKQAQKMQQDMLRMQQELQEKEYVEMLQDMIVAAVNEAMRAADSDAASTMQSLTGGLNLGGLGL